MPTLWSSGILAIFQGSGLRKIFSGFLEIVREKYSIPFPNKRLTNRKNGCPDPWKQNLFSSKFLIIVFSLVGCPGLPAKALLWTHRGPWTVPRPLADFIRIFIIYMLASMFLLVNVLLSWSMCLDHPCHTFINIGHWKPLLNSTTLYMHVTSFYPHQYLHLTDNTPILLLLIKRFYLVDHNERTVTWECLRLAELCAKLTVISTNIRINKPLYDVYERRANVYGLRIAF